MDRQDIEAIIHRQAWAWENGEVETIVSDFDEDSVFIAAGQQFNGKEEIQAAAEDYFRQFTGTKIQIKRIIIEGNSAAVEWSWTDLNRSSKLANFAEDAIIFQVKNHKIVYWREYIEKKD